MTVLIRAVDVGLTLHCRVVEGVMVVEVPDQSLFPIVARRGERLVLETDGQQVTLSRMEP